MSDSEGKFRVTYIDVSNDTRPTVTIDFGSVTGINYNMTKATSTIPLVSMGMDRAFQLESGSTLQYTVSFKRVQPSEIDNTSTDSTKWSNKHWYDKVTAMANRWQMKTNGCRLTYLPTTSNPYAPAIDDNGYIKVLTRRYTNKFNEVIEGTLQFIVGTTYVLSSNTLNVYPVQHSYKYIKLTPGVTSQVKAAYGMQDVYYAIDADQTHVTLPDMPHSWSLYIQFVNKIHIGWTVHALSDPVPAGARVNVSNIGATLTLQAVWK